VSTVVHFPLEREYRRQQSQQRAAPRCGSCAVGTTVEALIWSLRSRRTPALKEPDTRRRLAQLSDDQTIEVADRLQNLKPNIAQLWSNQEITELFIARKQCLKGR
jgi:hypothetical protein